MNTSASSQARRVPHPGVFMILIVPFGMLSGFLTVAVAYELSQAGVSVEQIAGLIALSFVPHTWKFLWAPLADITLGRKSWYVLAAVTSAAGLLATAAAPPTSAGLMLLYGVVLVSNVAVTFLAMATEGLMVHGAAPAQRGRVAGWFQAGNLGGGGLGGGAGLWMTQNLPEPWMAGAVLALVCLLCCGALRWVEEPPPQHSGRPLHDTALALRDLWQVLVSRAGLLALLICVLPLGTGAALGLSAAVAGDWHAGAGAVALVSGVLGGIAAALGCFAAGPLCDRMDRKRAYLLFGLLQGVCALAMAFGPRTEMAFVVFTLLYSFTGGMAYTGFSAVVLEVIGHGAAATKYTLFSSFANMPIAYMTLVAGWAHTRWGSGGMLITETVIVVLAVFAFMAAAAFAGRRSNAADLHTAQGPASV